MVLNAKELVGLAREKWKTDTEICNKTGLSRATLWRMSQERFDFHPKTIGKLVKALNDD